MRTATEPRRGCAEGHCLCTHQQLLHLRKQTLCSAACTPPAITRGPAIPAALGSRTGRSPSRKAPRGETQLSGPTATSSCWNTARAGSVSKAQCIQRPLKSIRLQSFHKTIVVKNQHIFFPIKIQEENRHKSQVVIKPIQWLYLTVNSASHLKHSTCPRTACLPVC